MTVLAYFARHGETTLNKSNCFRGRLNPDLNTNGRQDAEELAKFFEPIQLSAIFYSNKNRSEETAGIIAQKKSGIKCFGTESLWPLNVGDFSGKKKDAENQAKMDWYVEHPSVPIPGGESLTDFKNRIRPCIMEALELANKAGAPVLCVIHSSVAHEVSAMFEGHHHAALVKPGGVVEVYTENGQIHARPIIKPDAMKMDSRADTIS
jgi:alpha-ribazole phosphatase